MIKRFITLLFIYYPFIWEGTKQSEIHFVHTRAPDWVAVARVALSGPNFTDVMLPQFTDPSIAI